MTDSDTEYDDQMSAEMEGEYFQQFYFANFKMALKMVITRILQSNPGKNTNPISSEHWSSELWASLFELFTQDILNQSVGASSFPADVRNFVETRPPKKLERLQRKQQQELANAKAGKVPNYFRGVVDAVSYRVHAEPKEFEGILQKIEAGISDFGGYSFRKGKSAEHPYGIAFDAEGTPIDIVAFIYGVYAGQLVEIQVLHPFAALTFELDSLKDADETPDKSGCFEGKTDLWTDGFYSMARHLILDDACSFDPRWHQLANLAKKIHGVDTTDKLPVELTDILPYIENLE